MNFTNQTEGLRVTVDFLYAVPISDIAFTVFDIDRYNTWFSGYRDRLHLISGSDGTTTYAASATAEDPSLVAISNNGTTDLTLIATDANNEAAGNDDSNNGNVYVSFGNAPFTSFTFTYSHVVGTSDFTDPSPYQRIGFSTIYVPEPSTLLLMPVSLLLLVLRRRGSRSLHG